MESGLALGGESDDGVVDVNFMVAATFNLLYNHTRIVLSHCQ